MYIRDSFIFAISSGIIEEVGFKPESNYFWPSWAPNSPGEGLRRQDRCWKACFLWGYSIRPEDTLVVDTRKGSWTLSESPSW